MASTAKIDVTASTKVAGEMVSKTMAFDAPRFDEDLKNLIDFCGGAKALFIVYMEKAFTIEKQAEVRRAIERENSNGSDKPRKKGTDLSKLGL